MCTIISFSHDCCSLSGSPRPATTTFPASEYDGFNQSVTYGPSNTSTPLLNNTAGIIDTGTTLILLASGMLWMSRLFHVLTPIPSTDAYARYQEATGAVFDEDVGLLRITPSQFTNLRSMVFQFDRVSSPPLSSGRIRLFLDNALRRASVSPGTLPPHRNRPRRAGFPALGTRAAPAAAAPAGTDADARLRIRQLNTAIGGSDEFVYLVIGDLGTPSGEGLDFVGGMAFLQRYYYALDTENNRLGFARTQFTNATTN